MIRKPYIPLIVISLSVLFSCRVTRPVASDTVKSDGSSELYIRTFRDLAIREMKRTGIPASITLAQGMIESGNGRGRVAMEANNHFGIKCHDDWTGPTIRHNDDRRNECFRKYRQAEESFRDHSDFLRKEIRYRSLFDLGPTDYKGWARGLKRAGYATNPDYANLLIRKIEEYNLDQYDKGGVNNENKVKEKPSAADRKADTTAVKAQAQYKQTDQGVVYKTLPERIKENNRIQYIIVNERDTKKSLEDEFQLLSWELQKYNELPAGFTMTPGQKLYIQPKRDRADVGYDYHVAKDGETMYAISQIYGIKLTKLYLMNRMSAGDEPAAGQKIWLRTVKPVD
jgi:hypothetical protein